MFADIKIVVDILRDFFNGHSKRQTDEQHDSAIVDLLKVYFVMHNLAEDGCKLLSLANAAEESSLISWNEDTVKQNLECCKELLARQALRLQSLATWLFDDSVLTFSDPDLRRRLDDVIGDKFDHVKNLSGIGAELVMTITFGETQEPQMLALIATMYTDQNNKPLSLFAARKQLDDLSSHLTEFRAICSRFASDSDVLRLSKIARNETKWMDLTQSDSVEPVDPTAR